MSDMVAAFQKVRDDDPERPLVYLPAAARALSASAIWDHQQNLAGRLRRFPFGAGDLIVSGTGNQPGLLGLMLACRSLDLVLMAVDPGTARAGIAQLADRFGAAAIIVPADTAGSGNLDGDFDLHLRNGERTVYPGAAMLKLTSGSTASPRATITTEAQLIADGLQIAAGMGIGPTDTQLAAIPLAHSYGLGVLVMPLLLQGTPFVLRESFVPQQLTADAMAFDVRRFPGVPFMFEYLLEHPTQSGWPARLNRLCSAGAPLPPDVIRAFHARYGIRVHSYYGTTETGGISYDDGDDVADVGTVGRPLPGVTLRLLTAPDEPGGRVHVRSAAVSSGYVSGDDGDFVEQGFRTGDYGTIAADGRLTLSGRQSTFINVAGRKVQPGEVEAALRALPDIIDVRVVSGKDERRGEHVVACVVPRPGSEPLTPAAVRRFCSARLAPYKVPREVVFIDAIPLTARGKTDREALAAAIQAQQRSSR